MISILLGLLTVALGGYGVYLWFGTLLTVLKGLLPISFVCGGIIAIIAGLSSLKK